MNELKTDGEVLIIAILASFFPLLIIGFTIYSVVGLLTSC